MRDEAVEQLIAAKKKQEKVNEHKGKVDEGTDVISAFDDFQNGCFRKADGALLLPDNS